MPNIDPGTVLALITAIGLISAVVWRMRDSANTWAIPPANPDTKKP